MYQVGDLIIYGSTGVCEVAEITMHDLAGADKGQSYYVLKPLYQNCTISTPVNTTKVFMRPIISKDEAERLIDSIPTIQPEANIGFDMRQLTEHYDSFFKNHDCADLIMLALSIYEKRQLLLERKQKFGTVDERYMKRAEELLYGELSAALGIQKDEMPEYIAARVQVTDGDGERQL